MHLQMSLLSFSCLLACVATFQISHGQPMVARSVEADSHSQSIPQERMPPLQAGSIAPGQSSSSRKRFQRRQERDGLGIRIRLIRRGSQDESTETTRATLRHGPSRSALEEQILAGSNKVKHHLAKARRHRNSAYRSTSNDKKTRYKELELQHIQAAQEAKDSNVQLVQQLRSLQKHEESQAVGHSLERRGSGNNREPATSKSSDQKDTVAQTSPRMAIQRPLRNSAVAFNKMLAAEQEASHHHAEAQRHKSQAEEHAKQREEYRRKQDSVRETLTAQQQKRRETLAEQHRRLAAAAEDRMEQHAQEHIGMGHSPGPSQPPGPPPRLGRRGQEPPSTSTGTSSERHASPHEGPATLPPPHGAASPAARYALVQLELERQHKAIDTLRPYAEGCVRRREHHRRLGDRAGEQQAAALHGQVEHLMHAYRERARKAEVEMERHARAIEAQLHGPGPHERGPHEHGAHRQGAHEPGSPSTESHPPGAVPGKGLAPIPEDEESEVSRSSERLAEHAHERPRPHPLRRRGLDLPRQESTSSIVPVRESPTSSGGATSGRSSPSSIFLARESLTSSGGGPSGRPSTSPDGTERESTAAPGPSPRDEVRRLRAKLVAENKRRDVRYRRSAASPPPQSPRRALQRQIAASVAAQRRHEQHSQGAAAAAEQFGAERDRAARAAERSGRERDRTLHRFHELSLNVLYHQFLERHAEHLGNAARHRAEQKRQRVALARLDPASRGRLPLERSDSAPVRAADPGRRAGVGPARSASVPANLGHQATDDIERLHGPPRR